MVEQVFESGIVSDDHRPGRIGGAGAEHVEEGRERRLVDRTRLVSGGQRDRHVEQHGEDAEHHLHGGRGEARIGPEADPARSAGSETCSPGRDDQEAACKGERPVRELRGDGVLEEVPPPGRSLEHPGRRPESAHLRKRRVDVAGLQSGDERARNQGGEDRHPRREHQPPSGAGTTAPSRSAGGTPMGRCSNTQSHNRHNSRSLLRRRASRE